MRQQVTFRGLSPSARLVEEAHRHAEKLQLLAPTLSCCHVVVESAARSARGTSECRVTVSLWGTGRGTIVGGSTLPYHARNLQPAIRKAFRAAQRQLEAAHAKTRVQAA